MKIQITQTRIIEWYEHWGGKVYVSFSGGKDSTVLLDLTRRAYPEIEAVFVDTGLEYPEIRDFVKTKNNVTWLHPVKYNRKTKQWERETFKNVIEKYGYPVISKRIAGYISSARKNKDCKRAEYLRGEVKGSIFGGGGKYAYLIDAPFESSEGCCNAMKKRPMKKFVKETGKHAIIGTMTEESSTRKVAWLKQGCNAFNKKDPTSQPMSFWTEQDILEYLVTYHDQLLKMMKTEMTESGLYTQEEIDSKIHPWASIYGDIKQDKKGKYYTTGEKRTGCMFCMFGCQSEKEPNRFQRMKITHPKQYDYCINNLGLGEVLDYIGVKY